MAERTRRRRRTRVTAKVEEPEVEVEETEVEEEEVEEQPKRSRRQRRSRTVVKEEPEDEDDDVEEEEEVEEKPKRRSRKVVKAEDPEEEDEIEEDEAEELEEDDLEDFEDEEDVEEDEAEEPVQVQDGASFADVLNGLKEGVVYQITKTGNGKFTVSRHESPVEKVAVGVHKGLTGKAYYDEVLSREYNEFREMWGSLSNAEREKLMKKDKIKWDEHDDEKVTAMRMSMAYQEFHDIEKYKPEYQSRKARAAIRG